MDWRLKAIAFRLLDTPGGDQIHYLLQRHVTRNWPRNPKALQSLTDKAEAVLKDCARHAGRTPASVLEIGAGRDLAVPLALRKLGISSVIASDVNRLAKLGLVQHAADRILDRPIAFDSWKDLDAFGVRYLAPHRVSANDPEVDCSCSNEVLEHVPPDQLAVLLRALRSVTRGLSIHSIDYSDHYARSDEKISRLNFLRYSDTEWRRFNSGKQYVNRLRHSDYLRLFKEAGFRIVEENSTIGEPPRDMRIAPEFQSYEPRDLFAIRGRIIAV